MIHVWASSNLHGSQQQLDGEFAENCIDTVCVGFQVLPLEFYKFFLEKGQVIRRKPESPEAVKEIKRIIRNYLIRKGYRYQLFP